MKKVSKLNRKLLARDAHEGFDASLAYIRPVDAATLIIIDSRHKKPKVLMGKRSAKHKFMPNKFVFPGGRLDAGDTRLNINTKLRAPVLQRLRKKTSSRMTNKRLQGIALAAIRETFEETGLLVGAQITTPIKTRNSDWNAFLKNGVEPSLQNIDFLGRAITPPNRARRFDTRFFCVEISEVYNDPQTLGGTGELLELHWLSFDEAKKKDLPSITHYVLLELEKRMVVALPERYKEPAFFFRTLGNKMDIMVLK